MLKRSLNTLALSCLTILISGCASQSNSDNYEYASGNSNLVACPTSSIYSPSNVIILNENAPLTQSAQKIKTIEIEIYNEYGIKRQQAQINEMLKKQAYALGGNAVIIIDGPNVKHYYAEVVRVDTMPVETIKGVAMSTSTSATSPK